MRAALRTGDGPGRHSKGSDKTPMEAVRCLMRWLSNIIYLCMSNVIIRAMTGPEDTRGRLRGPTGP